MENKKHPFQYVKPTDKSVETITHFRTQMLLLQTEMLALVPDCRERSLAITKLEETSMWINKAIVFTQDDGE